MNIKLPSWASENLSLLLNTGSLVGTTAVTSILGFVYWWLAAQLFPQSAVGLASGVVSAMMFLGTIAVFGLGTVLISELARRPPNAGSMVFTALLVTGIAGLVLGFLFALVAPRFSEELGPLAANIQHIGLFSLGVALTANSIIIDNTVIGFLWSQIQLLRNAVFAVTKLAALLAIGLLLNDGSGFGIYATWVFGSIISFISLAIYFGSRNSPLIYRPQLGVIGKLRGVALMHHVLNLALQLPGYLLPLIVTVFISAEANASFYAAWMIASFAYIIPTHLTTTLYAAGSADASLLADKLRLTLRLSLVVGVLACVFLLIGADLILLAFGPAYVAQARWVLRLLGLGVFPLAIRAHFVAIHRIHGQIKRAAYIVAVGAIVEVVFAILGSMIGGLNGLIAGWLIAVVGEAMVTGPTVYRIARGGSSVRESGDMGELAPGVTPIMSVLEYADYTMYDARFRFNVVMESLLGGKAPQQVCEEFQIDERALMRWQQEFIERGYKVFENGQEPVDHETEKRLEEMERQIEELNQKIKVIEKGLRTLMSAWSRRL
jgi:O-antigen/teichoic acid export membrane protein/transposase-like protein